MTDVSFTDLHEVHLVAAHCDDLAIGAGGTLAGLGRTHPGLVVRTLVLTGGGTIREHEERRALAALCPQAELDVRVLDLPDGHLPAHWEATKGVVAEFARGHKPDLVIGPHQADAHQDHRLLAEVCVQVYRGATILGYEIAKWEADLPHPNFFVKLSEHDLAAKLDALARFYPSQHDKPWFDEDTFRGLARLRGVNAGARWAEGFTAPAITTTLAKGY